MACCKYFLNEITRLLDSDEVSSRTDRLGLNEYFMKYSKVLLTNDPKRITFRKYLIILLKKVIIISKTELFMKNKYPNNKLFHTSWKKTVLFDPFTTLNEI